MVLILVIFAFKYFIFNYIFVISFTIICLFIDWFVKVRVDIFWEGTVHKCISIVVVFWK